MRIAMITTWKPARCGVATYSENLCEALSERGVEIDVVRMNRLGIKEPPYLEYLAKKIPEDVDLCHVQHEYGLFQSLEKHFYTTYRALHTVPLVTTMHSAGFFFQIDMTVFMHSDAIIVHNQFMADQLPFKSVIIPHGVPKIETLPREEAKEKLGIDPEVKTVGFFGFISPNKNVEDLLRACHGTDVTCILAGGFPVDRETTYMRFLRQLAPPNTVFTGYVKDEELPAVLGAMDVVVHPGKVVTESGSILTAIGAGKPVIMRDLGAHKDKPGLRFKNVHDLRFLITRVLGDEKLMKSMEKHSQRYAEANSWDKIAEKHIELYRQLTR